MTELLDDGEFRSAKKTYPHSDDSERACLGAVLIESVAIEELAAILSAEDFYSERHQLIYRAMLRLQERQREIDLLSLQAELEARAHLEQVGGVAYLSGLDTYLPDIGRLSVYAEAVRERSIRRRLIQCAGQTIRDCMDGGLEAPEVAARVVLETEALMSGTERTRGFVEVSGAMEAFMVQLEEDPPPVEGVVTGVEPIDRNLGGFEAGHLCLVGGRSGVGKTALLVQMMAREFLRNRRCAVVSLEMRTREILNRFAAHMIGVDSRQLRSGRLSSEQWKQLMQLRRQMAVSENIYVDDTPVQRYQEIAAKVRKLHRERRVKSVFLDFLSLVERPGRKRAHEEVDELAYSLSGLAKDLEISVVALCQLNRGPARENRPPIVADLREAGEQAAWYVVLLHRHLNPPKEGEDEENEASYSPLGSINLAKNRDGWEGRVSTFYDGPRLQWWDLQDWRRCAGRRVPLWEEMPKQRKIAG